MYLGNLTIYVTWWDKLPIDTENPGDLLLQHPLTVHYFFTPLGWLYAALIKYKYGPSLAGSICLFL